MAQNQNQAGLTTVRGKSSLGLSFGTVSAVVDNEFNGTIVCGQPVRVVDDSSGVPAVQPAANSYDMVDGVALYNIKSKSFSKNDALEIAGFGDCVYMESGGAVDRFTDVSLDPTNNGRVIQTSPGRGHVGYAYDQATAAGQLIRVILGQRSKPQLQDATAGNVDLRFPYTVIRATAGGDLSVGAPVEFVAGDTDVPRVTKANALGDTIAGYVINDGTATYSADDDVYIATGNSVIYLGATAAIGRGAIACVSLTDARVAPSTTNSSIIGSTLDRATAAAEVVRVRLDLPSRTTAS